MKRQIAIFSAVFLLIAGLGLMYSSQVIADLTVLYPTSVDTSGTKIILSPKITSSTKQAYHLVAQDAQRVVNKRLTQLNLNGYFEVVLDEGQLEVTLPPTENMPQLIHIITRPGEIEFIDGGVQAPPLGQQVLTVAREVSDDAQVYPILFVGKEIESIVSPTRTGDIFYQIKLKPEAAKRFTQFIETNNNAYVCLVIDKQVINCSKMYHWSNDTLDILPNLSSGTKLSPADLAIFLNSGPLPVSLEVVTN